MTSPKSPAEEVFEQAAERLNEPEKPKKEPPKYLKLAPPVNRAMKRAAAKQRRLQAKHFERWKQTLNDAGINWEDVLLARVAKLKEGMEFHDRTDATGGDGEAGAGTTA